MHKKNCSHVRLRGIRYLKILTLYSFTIPSGPSHLSGSTLWKSVQEGATPNKSSKNMSALADATSFKHKRQCEGERQLGSEEYSGKRSNRLRGWNNSPSDKLLAHAAPHDPADPHTEVLWSAGRFIKKCQDKIFHVTECPNYSFHVTECLDKIFHVTECADVSFHIKECQDKSNQTDHPGRPTLRQNAENGLH